MDFDGRPTAGAQVLASVSMIPWYPCQSGPALHCRVPFLALRASVLHKRMAQEASIFLFFRDLLSTGVVSVCLS